MTKIVFIVSDEWEGIYVNGRVVTQNHSIPFWEIARALVEHANGEGPTSIESKRVDDDWLMDQGYLPENIEDVQFSNSPR